MAAQKLSSFVRLDNSEAFERDYYIAHSSLRRITLKVLLLLPVVMLVFFVIGAVLVEAFVTRRDSVIFMYATVIALVSAVGTILFFLLKRPKVSHGYAAITNRRLMYYEYNEHPAENYQHVKSVHLDDVTGMEFRMERTWFSKSFYMVAYTSKKGIVVGAKGFLGILNILGDQKKLEPGPDALEFIQDMTGAIAARKFLPQSGSQPA